MTAPRRAPEREPLTIVVKLTARQQQQLLTVSDELQLPFHAVGEAAIVAFLEQCGHARRGRLKRLRMAKATLKGRSHERRSR